MLKIGDRVRTIGEATRANGKLIVKSWAYGTIGDTTPEHDNSGMLYRVDWDEGGYNWLCDFELTKIKEDTTMPKTRKVVKTITIAGRTLDPSNTDDLIALKLMAIVCHLWTGKAVEFTDLPNLYETDETCRQQITTILNF